MPETFRAKVRKVGTSMGLLIPKEFLKEQNIKEGEEVNVMVSKNRNLDEVLKMFGTARGMKPFVRDRADRLERY